MKIQQTSWNKHRSELLSIRQRVFVGEQGVPAQLEEDEQDASAIHFLLTHRNVPVGCARLLVNGSMGRMAIIPEYRNKKLGTTLLKGIEKYYQTVMNGRLLHANVQTQAYPFYWKLGFSPSVEFNQDAGITHVLMGKIAGSPNTPVDRFVLGKDTQEYQIDSPLAGSGMLHILSSYSCPEICISVNDLNLPMWRDSDTYRCLNRYLRESRQRSVRILIQKESPGIADHPLMQWQQRLSSRVQLRVHSEVNATKVIFKPYGLIECTTLNTNARLSDRVRVVKELEVFNDLWHNSQAAKEARRLSL